MLPVTTRYSTMKLQDISVHRTERGIEIEDAPSNSHGESPHPQEVIELLKARTSNQLFNCVLLASDEMELANHTIAKLYADPSYQPSMTVLQAIRAINAKLALCGDCRTQ